jgi:hypothetical protein
MQTIQIGYWHSPIKGIKYRHLETFPFSSRKQNSIIKYLLDKKLSVMIRPVDNGVMIWIDNGRFGQK